MTYMHPSITLSCQVYNLAGTIHDVYSHPVSDHRSLTHAAAVPEGDLDASFGCFSGSARKLYDWRSVAPFAATSAAWPAACPCASCAASRCEGRSGMAWGGTPIMKLGRACMANMVVFYLAQCAASWHCLLQQSLKTRHALYHTWGCKLCDTCLHSHLLKHEFSFMHGR